jgi:medium-chain acyl-[acyl-carrier-protein] hydrolase
MQKSSWVMRTQSDPARRLFCFPYAGGGASLYRSWLAQSSVQCEICPIQLPGRENRFGEPAITDINVLLPVLAGELQPYSHIPFAFFGHSMGALIAFALTRYLRNHGMAQPVHLFLSAQPAPQLPPTRKPLHVLDDAAFIDAIADLGGTPSAVLQNQELMLLMLPLLRADFTVYESYRYSEEPPLDCPMDIFGGLEDHLVPKTALQPWQEQTTGTFALTFFPGEHFFVHSQGQQILQIIQQRFFV